MCRCFITDNKIMKTVSEQLAMFNEPDACAQILAYIRSGDDLSEDAQVKIFELEEAVDIIKCLVRRYHSLCGRAQVAMMGHKDVVELVKWYTDMFSLTREAELLMFEHEKVVELVEVYVINNPLRDEAYSKMLKHEKAGEIIPAYLKHRTL